MCGRHVDGPTILHDCGVYSTQVVSSSVGEGVAPHLRTNSSRWPASFPDGCGESMVRSMPRSLFCRPACLGSTSCGTYGPMVRTIQQHGGFVRLHCHGRIRKVLDQIVSMGVDAIDPIEPPPQGDVQLDFVRREYGKQLVLFGNIEVSDIETHGADRVRPTCPADIAARYCRRRPRLCADAVVQPDSAGKSRRGRFKTTRRWCGGLWSCRVEKRIASEFVGSHCAVSAGGVVRPCVDFVSVAQIARGASPGRYYVWTGLAEWAGLLLVTAIVGWFVRRPRVATGLVIPRTATAGSWRLKHC